MIKAIFTVFLITSGLVGAYYSFFGSSDSTNSDPREAIPYFIFGLIGMWIPGIVALFFAKKEEIRLKIFQKPDWMFLLASLCAIGFCCVALALSIPFHQWKELEAKTIGLAIGSALVVGFTIMPFYALGEELFWRGYLHERLKHLGMLKASLVIGTIWGAWHAPFILMGCHYPNTPVIGLLFMMLLCIAGSPIFFWFRERGKSIFIPAVLHGMINSFAGWGFLVFQQPNPLLTEQGLPGIFVLASVSTFLVFRKTKKISSLA